MAQNKSELLAVLQLLRKHNLKVHLSWTVYHKHNLTNLFMFKLLLLPVLIQSYTFTHIFIRPQGTEDLLRREANLIEVSNEHVPAESDVSSVLAAYKSEGDPEIYETAYLELRRFVEESLDIYKASSSSGVCSRILYRF